jgi:hypothetical protein
MYVYTSNLDPVCQIENIFFLIGFFKVFNTALGAGACDITLYLRGLKELVIACLIIYHGWYLNTLSELLKTLSLPFKIMTLGEETCTAKIANHGEKSVPAHNAGLKNSELQPFSCTIIGVGFFKMDERKTVRNMITYNFSMKVNK